MRLQVFPLDFDQNGALITPRDKKLWDLAVDFCEKNLAKRDERPNASVIGELRKCWAVAKVVRGEPIEVTAIGGYCLKIDVPLLRFLDSKSGKKLLERMNDHVADQGYIGHEAFIYISSRELPEQKCSAQAEWVKAMNAIPADRFSYTIK